MKSNTQCDVLLVTVTDIETEALLKTAKAQTGRDYTTEPGNQKTYFDLGVIGGARIFARAVGNGIRHPGWLIAHGEGRYR